MSQGPLGEKPLQRKPDATTLREGEDFVTIPPGEKGGDTTFDKRMAFEGALKATAAAVEQRVSKIIDAGAAFYPKSEPAKELFAKARQVRQSLEKNFDVKGVKLASIKKIRQHKIYEGAKKIDDMRREVRVKLLDMKFVNQQLREAVQSVLKALESEDAGEMNARKIASDIYYAATRRVESELSRKVDALFLEHAEVESRTEIFGKIVE